MEKVSKNIYKGYPILDIREIKKLADEGQSIVQEVRYIDRKYIVRPDAFYLSWSLRTLLTSKFYYAIKKE